MPTVYLKNLNNVPLATLIQEGSKCPTITAGDISVKVMHDFEKAAGKFFNNKDIGDDKQVSKILDCFDDHRITDWVEVDRDCLIEMTFMTEFSQFYLQGDDSGQISQLSQNTSSFWQFVVLVQKMNSLLKGTVSHKDPRAVCERIETKYY